MNIKELEGIKAEIVALKAKIEEKYTKLKSNCHHPATRRKVVEQYFSGGYDYTAYTEYSEYCTLCDKLIDRKTVNHGWYS